MFEVAKVALTLCEDDVLVLVLAGHGEVDGAFKIGDDEDGNDCELTKAELEASLGDTKPLNDAEKGRFLLVLKNRKQYQELAVAIASNLGWGNLSTSWAGQMESRHSLV